MRAMSVAASLTSANGWVHGTFSRLCVVPLHPRQLCSGSTKASWKTCHLVHDRNSLPSEAAETLEALIIATRQPHASVPPTPVKLRTRKEKEGGAPRPVAVRVCTDCHFSLQTVTVASASAIRDGGRGAVASSNGGRNGGRDGSGSDNLADGGGDTKDGGDKEESTSRGIANGGGNGTGTAGGSPEGGLGVGGSGGLASGVAGGGLGFVESLEGVYLTEEIAGDVVLGDVLSWGRVEVRRSLSRILEQSGHGGAVSRASVYARSSN